MRRIVMVAVLAVLGSCAQPSKAPKSDPGTQAASGERTAPVSIYAPAGAYKLDPNHASLTFSVNHLGLSNYVVRLTRFSATVNLASGNDNPNPVALRYASLLVQPR